MKPRNCPSCDAGLKLCAAASLKVWSKIFTNVDRSFSEHHLLQFVVRSVSISRFRRTPTAPSAPGFFHFSFHINLVLLWNEVHVGSQFLLGLGALLSHSCHF